MANARGHSKRKAKVQRTGLTTKSWRRFVTRSSTEDPFGLYYRVVMGKICAGAVLCGPTKIPHNPSRLREPAKPCWKCGYRWSH